MGRANAWTDRLPAQAGFYEVWDPHRQINRIVRVFKTPNGALAVKNFCQCRYAFLVQMWRLPCFKDTHWRGPIHVPDGLPNTTECLLPNCEPADG